MTIPHDRARAAEESSRLLDNGLHVRQDGPRDAPALVLIHGTAASLRSWDLLVPLLTGSHRVIRVDLLGCGRSATPDGASYAVPDQARLVGAALDQLGVGHAVARHGPARVRCNVAGDRRLPGRTHPPGAAGAPRHGHCW